MKSIGFFPAVHDAAEQAELLARASWYLWPWRERIAAVRLWGAPAPAGIDSAALGLDAAISAQYPEIAPLLAIEPGDDNAAADALTSAPCDLTFIWRAPRNAEESALVDRVTDACRARSGVAHLVDPKTAMNEGSLYLWGCLRVLGDEASRVAECKTKYEALKTRAATPRVYVFGTGPSLDLLPGHDFSDGDAIVCNSIVANEALLNQTNPIAIVAGDPIFHAGCSQYAAAFRAQLRHVLETRDIFFVTVMRDYVQQLAQLPPHLHDRVIGVPFSEDGAPFHFDLDSSFHIAPEGNVLSLLLFPLGAALYERITVCGCDGRPLSQNQYFWSHHQGSQLSSDKMANIQLVHPAFFDRSYDDHYSEHVAAISRIVDVLEEAGKRVDTLTPSHIPALAARQCRETAWLKPAIGEAKKRTLLVSVNPDATDDYGHWVWYDRRLAGECRERGVDFVSIANERLQGGIREREGHFIPDFEHETWGAGNQRNSQIDRSRLREFESTLGRQAKRLQAAFPDHRHVFYAYTGSIPHAVAMYRVARQNPHAFFVINTFWTCVMDCLAEDYLGSWGAFLKQAQDLPNLRIFSITPQLKTIIRETTGVSLPELPHPTPSMAEPASAKQRAGKPFRVLFPGGMTKQKGFEDLPDILGHIRAHQELQDAELLVRATDTTGTIGDERAEIIARITAHARTVNKVMGNEEFLDWLADADVAVLPYRRAEWVYRNSALLVDLLYLGVPIVCARGTWLSDVIDQLGGGLTVDGDDHAAYAKAIATIRANRESFANSAARAARRYDAANSWRALVDSVLGVLSDPDAERPAPHNARADEAAPVRWWNTPSAGASEAAGASAAPAQENAARTSGSIGEAISFMSQRLVRSPIIIASWTAAAIALIFSFSELNVFEPIRTHLRVMSGLGALATVGMLAARYLYHRREGLYFRLTRVHPLGADIAAAIGDSLKARGMLRRVSAGVVVVYGAAWLATYVARLNGLASQALFDGVFWTGLALCACTIIFGYGSRVAFVSARRALNRVSDSIVARARTEVVGSTLGDNIERISALESQMARFSGVNLRLNSLNAAVAQLATSEASKTASTQRELAAIHSEIEAARKDVEAMQSVEALLQRRYSDLYAASSRLKEKVDAIEGSGFHVVERHMTTTQLNEFAKVLSEAFELELSKPMLGYAAHRVRELESRCQGRIAAPISDVLVRIATLMAVKRKDASVLEIGTLFGIGSLAMHAVCRGRFDTLKLTFLDPLSGYYGGQYGPPLADLWTGVPVTRETLEHNIRVAGVPEEEATILQYYSEDPDALAQASQERYDVLIIDGDHSFDGVMRDYTDYAPLVRKNGFIIFDDYEVPEWHGVTEAVNSILGQEGQSLQRTFLNGKTLVCRVRGTLAEARTRTQLSVTQSIAE